jgi:hypothetical protein
MCRKQCYTYYTAVLKEAHVVPGLFTHYFGARDVAPDLKIDRSAFYLGAVGPDAMYFHRALPFMFGRSLRKCGSAMHRVDPDSVFAAMADFAAQKSGEERLLALSFAMGFISHYALDSVTHPFVFYFSPEYLRQHRLRHCNGFAHNLIEHEIDTLLLWRFDGLTVADFDPETCVPASDPALQICAESLQYTCCKLLGCTYGVSSFRQAYTDTVKVSRFLHDKAGGKRRFIQRLERVLHTGPALSSLIWSLKADDWDYLNEKGEQWYNPTSPEKKYTDSFLQLYKRATELSVRMITDFLSCIDRNQPIRITDKSPFNNGKLYNGKVV